MTKNEMNIVFKDYPDALTLCEFAEMLGISQKLASKLIRTGEIEAIKVGRETAFPNLQRTYQRCGILVFFAFLKLIVYTSEVCIYQIR